MTPSARTRRLALALSLVLVGPSKADAPSPENDLARLRERATASLSRITGTVRVPGLRERVTVRRDRFGIPHIEAGNTRDLFFAQGFVQAQDRLFQMELWRRSTQGRLAELLGPKWVERDRMTRLVTRYRGDMAAEWASYDHEAKIICESFVSGVNAYVDSLGKRRPVEFEILDMGLEHWKAEDLLARAEAFGMSGNARNEVARARAIGALGADLFFKLAPIDPPVEPLLPPGFDARGIPTGLGDALGLIGGAARVASEDEGSNNWVVAPRRSTTGRPLLANDPHRALDHPSLRYLVHLKAPGWNVIGAVVPWFPGVAIGHNERVAWGLTIFQVDAQDLYIEELDPADPSRYRTPSGWATMTLARETVSVRGGAPVTVDLKYTRQGPVVFEDPTARRAYALRWTGTEPGTAGYLAGLALDRARNGAEFRRAARRWKMPGENFVWADVRGNVGYQATGLTPLRRPGSGLVPAPGWSGELDWKGFLDPGVLPSVTNPASGFVATANHNTLPPGYPHAIGYEWSPAFRIRRVRELLEAKPRVGLADMRSMQQDVLSLPARDLVPLLHDLDTDNPRLKALRDLLTGWDYRLQEESAAAAAFVVFYDTLLADHAASRLPPGASAPAGMRSLVSGATMIRDVLRTKPASLLRGALEKTLTSLDAALGPDMAAWRWGTLHKATFRHFLASDGPTRALLDRGPYPRPGDDETVNSTYRGASDYRQTGGASFREIIDVGDWDASVVASAPGQSGQPESPHYDDLIPYWREGRTIPLAFTAEAVERATVDRLVLDPR